MISALWRDFSGRETLIDRLLLGNTSSTIPTVISHYDLQKEFKLMKLDKLCVDRTKVTSTL